MDATLRHAIVECFGPRDDVTAVYVFGSTARGTAGPRSDVDVAVLFREAPVRRLDSPRFALAGELETVIGRPVDLVVLNDAPVDLRMRVRRDGEVVVDRDRAARIAFEVRTLNEYFDLEPVLTLYRSPRSPR